MYACGVEALRPGHVVAQSLRDARGEVLLQSGTRLTGDYIARLRQRGVAAVWVRDGIADDFPPLTLVSGSVRTAVTRNLTAVFDSVSSMSRELFGDAPRTTQEVLRGLGDRPLPLPAGGSEAMAQLYDDVEGLIAECLSSSPVAGLESLKTHSSYVFEHSVDVALVAAVLGKEVGLPQPQLRELALGALLHDIGYLYVEERAWRHPGPLSPAEREDVRRHPRMGFELVRRMPVASIVPAHVAYQHHERQDGRGYPRGLEGTGRIRRDLHERVDRRRLMLIAEIAAVADVYSALTSDRAHRPALLPDDAIATIESMAGTHLNREIADLLVAKLPRYPVGHWVEVRSGTWSGWQGVVTHVHPQALTRPRVLLTVDPAGGTTRSEEVDLAGAPDVRIACVGPDALSPAVRTLDVAASTGSGAAATT